MKRSSRIISVDPSGKVQSVETAGAHETRKHLSQLAWLLDSSIPIPGTRLTVGIDALLGLFPVLGDLLGVLISSYIVNQAARLGAPRIVLMRMAMNVAVEGIVGIIPFAGDVFDAAWKANQRNVRLLDAWLDRPGKTERTSRLFGVALVLALVAFLALLSVGGFFLVRWLIGAM
jgi:hypothetical protein